MDIAPLIEETLLLLERDATAAGKYRFERKFAAARRPSARRPRRDQAGLWNLCNNALRAMPDGGVLSVGLENGRRIGPDFDSRYRRRHGSRHASARIFEPFQSGFAGGTGLGLAIVYQILQAHRGAFASRPGRDAARNSSSNFRARRTTPRAGRARAQTLDAAVAGRRCTSGGEELAAWLIC